MEHVQSGITSFLPESACDALYRHCKKIPRSLAGWYIAFVGIGEGREGGHSRREIVPTKQNFGILGVATFSITLPLLTKPSAQTVQCRFTRILFFVADQCSMKSFTTVQRELFFTATRMSRSMSSKILKDHSLAIELFKNANSVTASTFSFRTHRRSTTSVSRTSYWRNINVRTTTSRLIKRTKQTSHYAGK